MQHAMVPATDECQVRQRRLAPTRPPDEVVAIAPDRRPVTAVEDAAAIAGDQRPAGGGRDLAVGVAGTLALELGLAKQPTHAGIARVPLCCLHWYRSDARHLGRWRALEAQQCLGGRRDHQMGALTADTAELAAIERPPREVDQGIDASLTRRPGIVVRRWRHQRTKGHLQRRPALEIQDAINADYAVLRLADVQIAPLVGAVGLPQRCHGIDPVLEALGYGGKHGRAVILVYPK